MMSINNSYNAMLLKKAIEEQKKLEEATKSTTIEPTSEKKVFSPEDFFDNYEIEIVKIVENINQKLNSTKNPEETKEDPQKEPIEDINCYSCKHFYLTYNREAPFGCRINTGLIQRDIQMNVMPSMRLKAYTGKDCSLYKNKYKKPPEDAFEKLLNSKL